MCRWRRQTFFGNFFFFQIICCILYIVMDSPEHVYVTSHHRMDQHLTQISFNLWMKYFVLFTWSPLGPLLLLLLLDIAYGKYLCFCFDCDFTNDLRSVFSHNPKFSHRLFFMSFHEYKDTQVVFTTFFLLSLYGYIWIADVILLGHVSSIRFFINQCIYCVITINNSYPHILIYLLLGLTTFMEYCLSTTFTAQANFTCLLDKVRRMRNLSLCIDADMFVLYTSIWKLTQAISEMSDKCL